MTITHFAVVPAKGRDNTFAIFDYDDTTGRVIRMIGELTKEEVETNLRGRGCSDAETEAIIGKAVETGPM